MDFGWADLLAALPGAIVGIAVARFETRLDDVEAALRATQVLLRVEEDRTHQLPPAPASPGFLRVSVISPTFSFCASWSWSIIVITAPYGASASALR